MPLSEKFSVVVLGLLFGAQLLKRSFFVKHLVSAWGLSIVGVFGSFLYWAWEHYQNWKGGGLTKFFLPPYRDPGYFVSYVGLRLFAPYLVSLAAAILLARIARFVHRRFGERFFESEEIALMALGVFLTGYPGFLFYLTLIVTGGFLLSTFYFLLSKGRAPLYHFWLPFAVLAILVKNWFIPQSVLNIFIF